MDNEDAISLYASDSEFGSEEEVTPTPPKCESNPTLEPPMKTKRYTNKIHTPMPPQTATTPIQTQHQAQKPPSLLPIRFDVPPPPPRKLTIYPHRQSRCFKSPPT